VSVRDPRVIEAINREFPVGPQMLKRFQLGDQVAHIRLGDGLVTARTPETVTVTFARRGGNGQHVVGCYDAIWFETNPTWLFHRGERAP